MEKEPFYITTPIYYVNDRPHIGHAYTTVACDVLARFMRLSGRPVKFLTGTDEHGQKVEKSAQLAGVTPQAFVDDVSRHFQDMNRLLNISHDDFIRTTEPRHIKAAQALWVKMKEKGHIYLGKYAGWYAVRDEAFYAESELVDGKAPTGAPVEWVEEPSYFFNLSQWGEKLLAHYEAHPEFIAPAGRRNEVISFVKSGLKDLSISRTTFRWGIPVPGDETHIMYVWLDALTNYISALGYAGEAGFSEFWPASVHMMGKDILRFHAVYWPAFLMAAELPLPRNIFAHGWWTIEGEKMSKSLGNVVAPEALVNEFGLDQTRYFLMREVPFGNDGNFSRAAMINRINSELANTIGNLVQRSFSMIAKHFGQIPAAPATPDAEDNALLELAYSKVRIIEEAFGNKEFNAAIEHILEVAVAANQYIDAKAPWSLMKQGEEGKTKAAETLYCLAESVRCISILLQPFMPSSSSRILDHLSLSEKQRGFECISAAFALAPDTPLAPPQPVFPRFSEKSDDIGGASAKGASHAGG